MSAVAKNTQWETSAETEFANIYVALASAQLEFGTVQKGSVNPAFKSKYADLADVAAVVIPPLARRGVAVLHYLVGESLSAMRTEFMHGATGTSVQCDVPMIVDKQNMQGMKSATTYAKRIGLESLSGVAPDDDDGNAAAAHNPASVQRQTKPLTPLADAKFQDLLPAWRNAIATGKMTAANVVFQAASRYTLTDEQTAAITAKEEA